ncbi:MAG: NTP transferase domain-containing protein [Bacteroidetes bacterium]|nr:NTP transferase domain-containing protein [Bacteroidota bacterium]
MHPDKELHTIVETAPLSAAMEKMGRPGHLRTLFLLDETGKVTGTLTDGDIRRAFLKGFGLEEPCGACSFHSFRFIGPDSDVVSELNTWKELGIAVIPVLDERGRLTRLLDLNKLKSFLPVTAVIMAGGFGQRLRPLTLQTPKPMLPLQGVPILEINIRRLVSYGVEEIYLAVNYLKEQIQAHFKDGSDFGCHIHYIEEDEPRGTIGALSELRARHTNKDILLFNADLLSNIDLEEMYLTYRHSGASLCMGTIPYRVNIPFAVLELQDHRITGISEKPTYTYYSNAGFYLFGAHLIQQIPITGFYNATDFTDKLISDNHIVVQFPILGYWSDIGSLEEYNKANEDIQYLDL